MALPGQRLERRLDLSAGTLRGEEDRVDQTGDQLAIGALDQRRSRSLTIRR